MPEDSAKGEKLISIRASAPVGARARAWLGRHLQSFFFALGQLVRAPGSALLTTLVIAVALALPAGLYVVLDNLTRLAGSWDGTAELSLFLEVEVSPAQAQELARELRSRPALESTRLIPPAEGMAEFRSRSGMDGVELLLDGKNPLPTVMVARVAEDYDAAALPALLEGLRRHPMVEHADLDLAWLQRLRAIIALFERGVLVLSVLLALGVLLIVGNTIRVGIDTRREEIEIARLFGATNAFIRRPFLYGGMLVGVAGAGLAWSLVAICLWLLSGPVSRITALYSSQIRLDTLGVVEGALLLSLGFLLGLFGAAVAVGRHLSHARPQ